MSRSTSAVRLRDLLGVFSDQAGLDDVTGTGASGGLGFGQGGLGGEPLSDDLIGCLAVQHPLPTGVVGGIEAAQELCELSVRIDGDGEHFGNDAAIEALDHAIGLWRARLDMAILCPEFGADLGKGLGEAAAVVCQYMCHAEGKRGGGFAQESDGTGFGFVVLDGEMDRARAAVDGDVEIDGVDGPNGIDVPHCGLSKPSTGEPPTMSITTIGLDTAKSVFQIHGVNEAGKVELKRKVRRSDLIAFFEKQERCIVVMEACGAAHHWARILTGLGHTVKLIAPEAVKPFVKKGLCRARHRPVYSEG